MTRSRQVEERQRQRAVAHRLLDAEASPGEGARAAGLIAFRERFDELAIHLLDSLPQPLRDGEVRRARQILAWRAGGRGRGELGPQEQLPQLEAEALINAALECCLPDEALDLLTGPCSALVQLPLGAELRQALSDVGRLEQPSGPVTWVLYLPDGDQPYSTSARRSVWPIGRDVPPDRPGAWRRLAAWMAGTRNSSVGRGEPLIPVAVAEGRLPRWGAPTAVLVPSGVLNRFTARHWKAVLSVGADIVVSGLRAHDAGAMTPALQEQFARHAPIGVADTTSALLLREWGIDAVVDLGDRPLPTAESLWNSAALAGPGPGWWARVQQASAVGFMASEDLLQLRREWLAGRPQEAEPCGALPQPTVESEAVAGVPRRAVTSFHAGADAVEVAMAVDERLAAYVPVVIESCLEHASAPVRFHVLGRGLSEQVLDDWSRLFGRRAEIHLYALDHVQYGDQPRLIAHTTISTLDRLVLPRLLMHVQRVIYLDVDLVVMGDLVQLWRTDLQGHVLAAKPSSSPGNKWGLQMLYHAIERLPLAAALEVRAWLHRSGAMLFRAFNAGVLVMDLQRMRGQDATTQLLALVEHCGMNDQDALNAYTRGAYAQLDAAWNAAPRQDVTRGARIIHFVGPVKPWHDSYISRKPEFERVQERVSQRRLCA